MNGSLRFIHRTCASSAQRVPRFVMFVLLFLGVLNFGTAVPAVHAAGTVLVDRNDDPTPIPSACTLLDTNDCSLRGAVIYANSHPGTEIVLTNAMTYTLAILAGGGDGATNGDLDLAQDATIDFGSAICFPSCSATIRGGTGWNDRIFEIAGNANVQMSGVTIRNGNDSTINGGGGILVAWGTLTLNSVTIRNNTSAGGGGGIHTASSPWNTNLILNSVTVAENIAGSCGGISAGDSLTITGGAITENTDTGASGAGGLCSNGSGTATINGTDISGNHIGYAGTGGIAAGIDSMVLTNVTVNNNDGQGIRFSGDTLNITGGTINGNGSSGIAVTDGANLIMAGATVDGNQQGISLVLTTSSNISSSNISNNNRTNTIAWGGGIALFAGALTLNTSTIGGNKLSGNSSQGGGIYCEGGANLTVNASTISGNQAKEGGGIYENGCTLSITNSTISNNTTLTGGSGGGLVVHGATSLSNVTITANQATNAGGGVQAYSYPPLKNSLVAGNTASSGPDCFGTLYSEGYNLLGSDSGCTGLTDSVNGDRVGSSSIPINPALGALANNGGSTFTHALMMGSPAINAGNPGASDGVGTHCVANDQRGTARPQNARCDIGAYEYNGASSPVPVITNLNPSSKVAGSSGFTLIVNGTNFISSSIVRWNGVNRNTTYVNGGQLTATIPSSDLASSGTANVTVFNGAPGGGTSNSSVFTVSGTNVSLFLPLIMR